ncbi:MAG: AMP-dependent synthetase/ligase [Gemmatimonadales bacterium]
MSPAKPSAEPTTLTGLYFGAIDRHRGQPAAMRVKRNGQWTPIGHDEVASQVEALSRGLLALGIAPGDRVAILSENRPEWALADYACLTARAIDVPIYPTLTAKQIAYLLQDSGARLVFVSTKAQYAKLAEVASETPAVQWVVALDKDIQGSNVLSLDDLKAKGASLDLDRNAWRSDALAAQPDDLATIIYTSGTTGEPKGVMLTHGNIASNVRGGFAVLSIAVGDEFLSLLPLSHIFERMTGHYCMFHAGVVISYAESIDTVVQDIIDVRPTVVAAVPRLYEKIYARALETASQGGTLKRSIFLWAKGVGGRWADLKVAGQPIPLALQLTHRVADLLVFRKLRNRVGGRLRLFLSGGAPLSGDIARFFYSAGLPILEGYGLTETSPVITVNSFEHLRFGTVGRAIPEVEVKIAEDGEILTRGPHVMRGYYKKPEATAEAIDAEGWFHTGDIGEIDSDGFLKITDRKKDLIATAGGKKIAPQPIENELRKNPFIANAVMLGDRRRFPIVLLAPEFSALESWAKSSGLQWQSREELIGLEQVQKHLEAEALKHLGDLARYERPKKFLVVPREFSIETGELTPKLSVRRKVVEEHYRELIDATYDAAESEGHTDTHLTL